MANNIIGFGAIGTRQAGSFRPLRADAFVITNERETESVQAFPYGAPAPLNEVDLKNVSSTWAVQMGIPSIDIGDLELIFDQKFASQTSIVVPTLGGVFTIPATTPHEVTIAGLTTNDVVDVTLLSDAAPGNVQMTTGSGAGAYELAAGKITFNAAEAGKSVAVYRRTTQSNLKVIGGPSVVSELGSLEIFGVARTTRGTFRIWMPNCQKDGGVSFDGSADTFELNFKALVPTALGWNLPYMLWQ